MSDDLLAKLKERQELAELGGGSSRLEQQAKRGKLSARQRISRLLDAESFVELDKFVEHDCHDFGLETETYSGDGVVSGWGKINGRTVFVFAQDFTVFGGSLSAANARKIVKVMELAVKAGAPIVGINDSGGARIQEGVRSLAGYADIFYRNVQLSGVVPQLSAVLGPCAGGAVYSPAITDFIFMTQGISHMFITGPDVIKAVNKEEVDKETLGGASAHSEKSGVAHFVSQTEDECFQQIRELLSYLPQSNKERPPRLSSAETQDPWDRCETALNSLIPQQSNRPYDMRKLILAVLDQRKFLEVQAAFARNIIVGLGRINGYSVGIVANQPQILAGCLDIDASVKAARFVRFCDAFNIPVITFVDVPGFLPGTRQEHGGIIRHGAKLLYAFAEATVPKITLITRKAYGGAYDVMSSKHIGADINLAFPSAEVAVMGPEGAVSIIFRDEINSAAEPAERKKQLVEDYRERFANPWTVASSGYVDTVIEPAETRKYLSQALDMLADKQAPRPNRKHGNIPL